MKSHEDNSRFLANYTTISGAWTRSYNDVEKELAWNPKLAIPPVIYLEKLPDCGKFSGPSFSDDEFLDFAEALKVVGRNMQKAKPDIILVPMRGAVRLWEHLRIFCNIPFDHGCLFPFTDKEKFSYVPREIIAMALRRHTEKERLNIVCIDESEGGQGTRQLLNILDGLHCYDKKSTWTITFCLLVPKGCQHAPWKYEHIKRTRDRFIVNVHLTEVERVIGKDLNAATISPENLDCPQVVKMRSEGADYIIETRKLPKVIDQKIVEATHFSLLAEPYWFVDGSKTYP